jgi:two-component system, OmpR family, response regulator MprA
LVVDDERTIRDALARALRADGYDVAVAADGMQALDMLAVLRPDALVLDVMMPRVDGLEACRRLRAAGARVPVLMLTARDAIEDRVEGLDAGADDYLVKPFALEELLARVRALLRRSGSERRGEPVSFSDVTLDGGVARRGERDLELTRTEYSLLELFLLNPRQVMTRDVIFERVWGYSFSPGSNAIEVYVSYLRRKLEAGGEPRLIQTVRGMGYILREP